MSSKGYDQMYRDNLAAIEKASDEELSKLSDDILRQYNTTPLSTYKSINLHILYAAVEHEIYMRNQPFEPEGEHANE